MPTDKVNYSQSHEEHIIQNAILGHYTSHEILCKECGGAYSKDDDAFAKIFSSFIELMRSSGVLRKKDRKDKPITVSGAIFPDKEVNGTPISEVVYRDGKIEPKKPDWKVDKANKTIEIYHSSTGYNRFEHDILEKLKGEGLDIENYTVIPKKELSKQGFLALYFSKDKPDFNVNLLVGLSKIAVEFALDKGIAREDLKDALVIEEDGKAHIPYDKTMVYPFCTLDMINSLFQNERHRFESTFPSHSLHLFTVDYGDAKALYCYIDLFSTFQYYVILNTDYKGEDVNEWYAQKLKVNYTYSDAEIDYMSDSDLDIVINENKLDYDAIRNAGANYRSVIKDLLRKRGPEFDLMEMKNNAFEAIFREVTMYLCKIQNKTDYKLAFHQSSIEIIKQYIVNYGLTVADLTKILNFNKTHYRDMFLQKEVKGELKLASYPSECADWYNKHKEVLSMYTMSVFSKLCGYCHEMAGVNQELDNIERTD